MEKSTEIDLNLSDYTFIGWLIARLRYLHGYSEEDSIIKNLGIIQNKLYLQSTECSDEDLDKIISKYFVDFYLIKDENSSIGYTDIERDNLRNAIKQIISDFKEKNIPKEILLK